MISILRFHFFIINLVALTSFPLTYLFLSSYDILMRATLICLLINNIIFVVMGLKSLKIKKQYIILFFLISISLWIGIKNNALSIRTIVDEANVFLFFFKILIIANLCKYQKYYLLIVRFFKTYILLSMVAAVIGTMFFYLLPQNADAYVGLTPVIIPFMISSLVNGSLLGVCLAILIVFLSGKRAMLISGMLVMVLYYFKSRKKLSLKILIPFALALPVLPVLLSTSVTLGTVSKLESTFKAVQKVDDDILFKVVGPRVYEITSIVSDMEPIDYIMGKGGGYTYDLIVGRELLEEEHANAHFTPIALISKYGLVLFGCIVFFFMKAMRSKIDDKILRLFLKLYLVSFIFESMFSYLIFNDKILHFVIGMLIVNTQTAHWMKKNNV